MPSDFASPATSIDGFPEKQMHDAATPDAFGPHSAADEVLSGLDLSEKRVLITGVSAGLGVETARALVAYGAQVIGAVRNIEKGRTATADFERVETPGCLQLLSCDLGSLQSVRSCAQDLIATGKPIDVLITNAARLAENDDGGRSGVRPYAVDPARARQLWALSERMVGEAFQAE